MFSSILDDLVHYLLIIYSFTTEISIFFVFWLVREFFFFFYLKIYFWLWKLKLKMLICVGEHELRHRDEMERSLAIRYTLLLA